MRPQCTKLIIGDRSSRFICYSIDSSRIFRIPAFWQAYGLRIQRLAVAGVHVRQIEKRFNGLSGPSQTVSP
ncbi:hypothetical protein LMG9964_05659 [Paraburkholderia phenoliruptrix]|uniref:Uncharacterized protein n=1 Tax=Paraburkholderia phenoliruptrix TaxID=252970 RepID=A0A6J5KG60_9BURK|nr:hypothetical protein LMG9964_05659 [Paraburkholderia phenoliruptrix]